GGRGVGAQRGAGMRLGVFVVRVHAAPQDAHTRTGSVVRWERVEGVRQRAMHHQLAVARRRGDGVSDHISDILARSGNADLVGDLFDDQAETATSGADADTSRLDTRDLNPDLARRLCLWVSVALRQHLLEQFKVDEVALDDALEHAVEEAGSVGGWSYTVSTTAETRGAGESNADAVMIAHLRRGDIPQFEAVLSRISGLRPQLIGRMVYERGGEALATICMATNMNKRSFAAIFLLSREAWPEQEEVGAQEVAHALSFFDQLNPVAAKRVVARWRRNSDYLNAIRQVSAAPKIALVQRS
ncbi:MAG: DUF2336 domain-containing protein, partial [Alphaproteobacteria bacterium]